MPTHMTIPRLAPDCRALLRQGFIYVRTVVLPHNPSGALFPTTNPASVYAATSRAEAAHNR